MRTILRVGSEHVLLDVGQNIDELIKMVEGASCLYTNMYSVKSTYKVVDKDIGILIVEDDKIEMAAVNKGAIQPEVVEMVDLAGELCGEKEA